MEKEKMVEEMAMLLCKDICFRKICAVTNHCQIKNCKMREKATLLYYFIVKKYNDFIPEGSVMLTKEEVNNTEEKDGLSMLAEYARARRNAERVRKETAMAILQLADAIATGSQNDGVCIIEAIKNRYGVEV